MAAPMEASRTLALRVFWSLYLYIGHGDPRLPVASGTALSLKDVQFFGALGRKRCRWPSPASPGLLSPQPPSFVCSLPPPWPLLHSLNVTWLLMVMVKTQMYLCRACEAPASAQNPKHLEGHSGAGCWVWLDAGCGWDASSATGRRNPVDRWDFLGRVNAMRHHTGATDGFKPGAIAGTESLDRSRCGSCPRPQASKAYVPPHLQHSTVVSTLV